MVPLRSRCSTEFVLAVLFALLAMTEAPAHAQSPLEAFSSLPAEEIPARQIGWTVNRTIDALMSAVDADKPLVLVMGETASPMTQAFATYVASCPHLNQLAGAAVFAYGSPAVDEHARRIALALKVTHYPTISVIAPRTDALEEL